MKRKFIEYTVILSLGTVISNLFMFLFRVIIARDLSLSDYGVFSLLTGFYSTLIVFAHFDIAPTLSKYFSEFEAKKKDFSVLYYSSLGVIVPTTLLSFFLFLLVLSWYRMLTMLLVAIFFIMFVSNVFLEHNSGILRGLKKFKIISLSNILAGLSRYILILFFFYCLGINTLTTSLIAFALSFILPSFYTYSQMARIISPPKISIDTRLVKSLYSFSFFLVISDLASSALLLLPRIILSFNNLSDVAIFDLAIFLYGLFGLILSNIPASLIPLVSERNAKSGQLPNINLKEYAILSLIFLSLGLCMFYVGLDSFLIQRIFGEKFLTSLPAFHALFITIPFFTYSIILSGILQGIGKVKELAISYLLALLFGVPVLILAGTLSLTVMAVGLSLIIIIRAIFLHSVYTRLLQ